MKKTLKEVEQIVGLNRRKIQELEKSGLAVKPRDEKDGSYTKLMYDTEHIDALWRLRFYLDLGYEKADIREIINDKTKDRKELLGDQIKKLEKKIKEMQNTCSIAKDMYELGITPTTLAYCNSDKNISYNDLFNFLGETWVDHSLCDDDEDTISKMISEEDCMKFQKCFRHLKTLFDLEYPTDDHMVQEQIKEIHQILAVAYSESVLLFNWFFGILFYPNMESSVEIDEWLGKGFSAFYCKAMQTYVKENNDNTVDLELRNAFECIAKYTYGEHYHIDSPKVVQVVEQVYNFFSGLKFLPKEAVISMMHGFANLFSSSILEKQMNNEVAEAVLKNVSNAIEYYCVYIKNTQTNKE